MPERHGAPRDRSGAEIRAPHIDFSFAVRVLASQDPRLGQERFGKALNTYQRKVGFDDVDAAGLVFFATVFGYAHEAMEALFDGLDGGYRRLICERRIGLPAVHVEADYRLPLRYGDTLRVDTSVVRIGNRSLTLRHRLTRLNDAPLAAEVLHTVVCTDLDGVKSCPMPDDVRRIAETHLERP